MNADERAHHLIQTTYYDSIDRGDFETAVTALHEDVVWNHVRVWQPTESDRTSVHELRGRNAVYEFLEGYRDKLAQDKTRHLIERLVTDGEVGAQLGAVVGPDGESAPMIVWFEITDGLISRYTVRPL